MSRNAIVTVSVREVWDGLGTITSDTMASYAHRIGADFIIISSIVASDYLKAPDIRYEKFQIYDLLGIYDRVMLVDFDAAISKYCPNIFDVVDENRFGIKVSHDNLSERRKDFVTLANEQLGKIEWGDIYYNSGVMVVSSIHRKVFEYRQRKGLTSGILQEQNTINYRIYKDKIPVHVLDWKYHYIPAKDKEPEINPFIIHWAGGGRGGWGAIYEKTDRIIADIEGKYKHLFTMDIVKRRE